MRFPKRFLWGVSASSFQFEMGGANIDPNTDWYAWVHDRANIERGLVSGDLPERGINYWDLYKKDHALAKSLGLNAYRIGIEWSRIFPADTSLVEVGVDRAIDGRISEVGIERETLEKLDSLANHEALEHYWAIIEDLRSRNFKVFVCLNHFTLPLWIHDPLTARKTWLRKGPRGWLDERTVVEFTKFAAYAAWKLGGLVDWWAILNEPMGVAVSGYLAPEAGFPPGVRKPHILGLRRTLFAKAAINMIIAHARAYDAIKRWDTIKAEADSPSPAEVGLIHNPQPMHPLDPKRESDLKAVEFADHLYNHFFVQPISSGWLDEDFNGERDPGEFKKYLRRRLDWLGLNYYSRVVHKGWVFPFLKTLTGFPAIPQPAIGYGPFGGMRSSFFQLIKRGFRYPMVKTHDESLAGLPITDFGWEVYPEGMAEVLRRMKDYGIPMYITENGIADAEDKLRPRFVADHLEVLERAIGEEKLDVRGYFHWALTDNYEWAKGFEMKFGLWAVDLRTKRRVPRRSAGIFKEIVKRSVTESVKRRLVNSVNSSGRYSRRKEL